MANPVSVPCTAGEWTPVAINVTTGQIKKLDSRPNLYLETYRMTGGDVPASRSEGVPIFLGTNAETISAAAAIDVYIMAIGADGRVRVDL